MDRWTPQRALHSILFHHFTSMVLLQIDPQGIAIVPLEGDAPRAIDMNTASGGGPLQAMEVEPRDI